MRFSLDMLSTQDWMGILSPETWKKHRFLFLWILQERFPKYASTRPSKQDSWDCLIQVKNGKWLSTKRDVHGNFLTVSELLTGSTLQLFILPTVVPKSINIKGFFHCLTCKSRLRLQVCFYWCRPTRPNKRWWSLSQQFFLFMK